MPVFSHFKTFLANFKRTVLRVQINFLCFFFFMKVLILPGTLRGSIVAPLAPLFEFNTIETPGYRKEMEKYHISKDRYNQGKNKGL